MADVSSFCFSWRDDLELVSMGSGANRRLVIDDFVLVSMGSGANGLVLFDDFVPVSIGSGANLRGCLGAFCSDMAAVLAVAEGPHAVR